MNPFGRKFLPLFCGVLSNGKKVDFESNNEGSIPSSAVMLIKLIIDTDDKSVIVLLPKSCAESREVKETIDKELVTKVKKLLPQLAEKIRSMDVHRRGDKSGV